jgi:hypothetical protein
VPRVFDLSPEFKLKVFDELSSTALSIGEYFPDKDDFLVLWVSKGGTINSMLILKTQPPNVGECQKSMSWVNSASKNSA